MQVLKKLQEDLKNDFLAGLLVVIPLATTIWLSYVIATWAIDLLTRIPKQLNPLDNLHPVLLNLINFCIGLTVPLVFILSIGLMARNIVGQWLLHLGERIVQAIPLAGAVYKTVKQILETIFQDTENKFRRVVLVEYPRKGIWSIGFVTGRVSDAIGKNFDKPLLSVFIPTTPNPTTGWYAIVAEEEVITLDMSIEDAFKILLSGGIVNPNNGNSNPPPTINNGYKGKHLLLGKNSSSPVNPG